MDEWTRAGDTFTPPANTSYFIVELKSSSASPIDLKTVQIEKGTAYTSYQESRRIDTERILPGAVRAHHISISDLSAVDTNISGFSMTINKIYKLDEDGVGMEILSNLPAIRIADANGYTRAFMGVGADGSYGLGAWGADGSAVFDAGADDVDGSFVKSHADLNDVKLGMMKMNFQSIEWAQFSIFDSFEDESKRLNPDTSANPATVYRRKIMAWEDDTPNRVFGFLSKVYSNITTIHSGVASGSGQDWMEDTDQDWFVDECKELTLYDSNSDAFPVISNTAIRLTVSGYPYPASYQVKTEEADRAIAFCEYKDSTNGGYGYTKMEVTFDNTNYETILDTENSTDLLEKIVQIQNKGTEYAVRLSIKNDSQGRGAKIYRFLVATDPTPWLY